MKSLTLSIFFFLALTISHATLAQGSYNPEQKLKDMGIEIKEKAPSASKIVSAVRTGNLVFLSGHGPTRPDGTNVVGKLGADLSVEQGQEAARLTGIQLLTSLKAEIGDLNKVKRVVKVLGMVNSTPDFVQSPAVINGFTDLMLEVFGEEKGKHARSAVGMVSLPNGIAVEIEMIVEIED
jgi:enamine deaminase RidA (YjgF/YER057c/UK114 family)